MPAVGRECRGKNRKNRVTDPPLGVGVGHAAAGQVAAFPSDVAAPRITPPPRSLPPPSTLARAHSPFLRLRACAATPTTFVRAGEALPRCIRAGRRRGAAAARTVATLACGDDGAARHRHLCCCARTVRAPSAGHRACAGTPCAPPAPPVRTLDELRVCETDGRCDCHTTRPTALVSDQRWPFMRRRPPTSARQRRASPTPCARSRPRRG